MRWYFTILLVHDYVLLIFGLKKLHIYYLFVHHMFPFYWCVLGKFILMFLYFFCVFVLLLLKYDFLLTDNHFLRGIKRQLFFINIFLSIDLWGMKVIFICRIWFKSYKYNIYLDAICQCVLIFQFDLFNISTKVCTLITCAYVSIIDYLQCDYITAALIILLSWLIVFIFFNFQNDWLIFGIKIFFQSSENPSS